MIFLPVSFIRIIDGLEGVAKSYFYHLVQLFGIGNANPEQTEQLLSEEGFSVFTVSKRKYLGDAGGSEIITIKIYSLTEIH